jgi:hypothetical protein
MPTTADEQVIAARGAGGLRRRARWEPTAISRPAARAFRSWNGGRDLGVITVIVPTAVRMTTGGVELRASELVGCSGRPVTGSTARARGCELW